MHLHNQHSPPHPPAPAHAAGKWWVLLWFLALGPVLLATILIHELGHCLAARSVGGTAESILLWPLGGRRARSGVAGGVGAALHGEAELSWG